MDSMKEYELEDEELRDLTIAMYGFFPLEYIEKNGALPPTLEDARERCNKVWQRVAKERNIDWESIILSEKGLEYFMASEFPKKVIH